MKRKTHLFMLLIIISIFTSCNSISKNSIASNNTSDPKVEDKNLESSNDPIIIGAWQNESKDGSSVIYIFNKNNTVAYLESNKFEYEGKIFNNKNKFEHYYDVVENGKGYYKLAIKNININFSGEVLNLYKGSKESTLLIGVKDKDTIQLSTEGSASIKEMKRINLDMARSILSKSIFDETGNKSLIALKNYVNNLDNKENIQSCTFSELFVKNSDSYLMFDLKYKDTTESFLYINSKDFRLYNDSEYMQLNTEY